MFLPVAVVLLTVTSLVSAQGVCPAKSCRRDLCGEKGLACCVCQAVKYYAAYQVCSCCPPGYICCSTSLLNPTCCPKGTTCDLRNGGCLVIDTAPAVTADTVCSPCDPLKLSITCDDAIVNLYIDGVSYTASVNPTAGWGTVRTIQIPADSEVIAVNCKDTAGVVAGVLMSTNNDYIVTSTAWKCTATNYPGWNLPTYNDAGWSNAVISGAYPTDIHGNLPPISPTADWIWTANYVDPKIDANVFCRYRLYNNGCKQRYGNCTNLCKQQQKVCCQCSMTEPGPMKVCTCCPKGYHCCASTISSSQVCCPFGYVCSSTATGPQCVRKIEFPIEKQSVPAEPYCGPCV